MSTHPSKNSHKKQRSVLLALGWQDHRLLNGIATFATEQNWHISAASITKELSIPWGWEGDGVLAWLAASDDLSDFVCSLKKPTVDMSLRRAHLPFTHVALDHAACADLVADHFLTRGFKNFIFYSDSDNWTSEERGTGFVKALAREGLSCPWFKWHKHKDYRQGRGEWKSRRAWLMSILKKAAKPLAVFTANGTLAVEILEVCEMLEIQVPQEVALIGIEDDLLLPLSNKRSITTVEPNLEELGYQGAAWLDRLMRGHAPPKHPVRIPPARIIARKSTDITAVPHESLGKALRFVEKNFHDVIDVDHIARHAGMSRRGLHQAFVDHIGRTPGEHLRMTRIERAKTMLCETTQKVETVASACGYPSVNSFFIAFRQVCGITPGDYRKSSSRSKS